MISSNSSEVIECIYSQFDSKIALLHRAEKYREIVCNTQLAGNSSSASDLRQQMDSRYLEWPSFNQADDNLR